MAKILKMPQHLADLIAAGEVVERPSSVVKELVENSIDAGATSISVEIRGGGMEMIRITDNGCGMSSEDAEAAFLRHATSKLRDERGLEAIGTLGFRGEALAAVSAVSRIELITRESGADEGTRVELEAGRVVLNRPEGCPEGTTIIVRDLFFNTPARLKFMKNDRAETSAVTAVVLRIALSHPEISVKYVRDGKTECHTPGDGKLDSCIYSALGREFASGMLPVASEDEHAKVWGYVSAPAACRGNRSWQIFFLNGRLIRSKLLQAALEQAYKNVLFTGRFPACIIFIKMRLSAVDVNVHPTKAEVRFADERAAFNAVYWAAKNALGEREWNAKLEVPSVPVREEKTGPAPKENEGFKTMSAETFREKFIPKPSGGSVFTGGNAYKGGTYVGGGSHTTSTSSGGNAHTGGNTFRTSVPPIKERSTGFEVRDTFSVPYQTRFTMPALAPAEVAAEVQPSAESKSFAAETIVEEREESFRIIGEAMNTYVIAEKGESIFLIDKHAAHERMIFDRLKTEKFDTASQILLTPIVCAVDGETAEIIEENGETLREFGFEIDRFGESSVAVRQLPAEVREKDAAALVEELAEKLKTGHGMEEMRDGIMKTMACKAAIKAGHKNESAELYGLVEKVLSGEVKYCPHGRPVAMEITKSQLDRGFRRA